MAGNTDTGVCKFGKLSYFDPNVAVFKNKEGTNSDSINFPYEDYTMAIDLLVRSFNRYSCGLGLSTGQYKDFVYSTQNGTLSFLGGSDVEGGKGQKYLTTNYTDISLTSPSGNTQECLGIESIEITYQSWFHPNVTIKFVDVRGGTVLSKAESSYYNPGELSYNSNLYRAFFSFPYPMFILKVKGFYGKGVNYRLAINKTTIDLDASSGNFIITVEFIGHMYGVLADIPMTYISIAPYTETGGDYWKRQIDNRTFYFRDTSGRPTSPMLTLPELKGRIYDALKAFSGSGLSVKGVQNEQYINAELDSINEITRLFTDAFGSKDDAKRCSFESTDSHKPFVYTRMYTEDKITKDFQLKVYSFCTSLSAHDYTFNTHFFKDFNSIYTGSNSTKQIKYNTVEIHLENNNLITHSGTRGQELLKRITGSQEVVKWVRDSISSSTADTNNIFICVLSKDNQSLSLHDIVFSKEWEDYKSELKTRNESLKKEIDKEQNQFLEQALGFIPSIRNIYELVFAHLDTFFYVVFERLKSIRRGLESKSEERRKDHYGVADENTDTERRVKKNGENAETRADFLPPFVAYYKNNPLYSKDSSEEERNENTAKEKVLMFPDEEPIINGTDLEEVNLIYELLDGAKMFYEKRVEEDAREANDTGPSFSPSTDITNFIPLTIYDIANNGKMENPYSCLLSEFKDNKQEVFSHFLFIFAMRINNYLITTVDYGQGAPYNTGNKDYTFGRIEAYNFYKAVGEVVSSKFFEFLKTFSTKGNKAISQRDFIDAITGSNESNLNCYWINEDKRSLFRGNENDQKQMIYNYSEPVGNLALTSLNMDEGHGFTYFPLNVNKISDLKKDLVFIDEIYNTRNDYITTTNISRFSGTTDGFRIGEPLNGGTYFIIEEGDIPQKIYENLSICKQKSDEMAETSQERDTYGDADKTFLSELRNRDINRLKGNFHKWERPYTYWNTIFRYDDGTGSDINSDSNTEKLSTINKALVNGEKDEIEKYYVKYPVTYLDYEKNPDSHKNDVFWMKVYTFYDAQKTRTYAKACIFLFGIPLMGNSAQVFRGYNGGFDENCYNGSIPKLMLLKEGAWYWFQNNKNDSSKFVFSYTEKQQDGNVKNKRIKIPSDDEIFAKKDGVSSGFWSGELFYPFYLIEHPETGENKEKYAKVSINMTEFYKFRTNSRKKYLEEYFKYWVDNEFGEIDELILNRDFYVDRVYYKGLDVNRAKMNMSTVAGGDNINKLQKSLRKLFFTMCTQFDYYREYFDRNRSISTVSGRFKDGINGFLDSMSIIYKSTIESVNKNDYDTINEKIANLKVEDPFNNSSLKLSTYMTMKNLYDKWICGFPNGKETYIFNKHNYSSIDSGVIDNFIYCDNFFHDIGDILTVNITKVGEWFNQLVPNSNIEGETGNVTFKSESIYEFLTKTAELVGASLIAIPQKMMYTDSESIKQAFTPIPTCLTSEWDDDSSTYMVLYSYKNSEHLGGSEETNIDLNGWSQEGDGFDLTDADITGELFKDSSFDSIPAFGVTFGKQNQAYFKNISLTSASPGITEVGISNTLNIASKSGEEIRTSTLYGQDIYKIYSNYSYECTVEMLGCMQIFPPMYFQLNNVPMWKGAYMIQKVKHSIKPGDITTTITGVRMNKYAIPLNDTQALAFVGKLGSYSTGNATATIIEDSNVDISNIIGTENNITGNRNLTLKNVNESDFKASNIDERKPLICITPAHGPDTKKKLEWAWSSKLIDNYIIPKLKQQKFYDGTSYADNIHRCNVGGKNTDSTGYSCRETKSLITKYGSKCVISLVPHWNGGGSNYYLTMSGLKSSRKDSLVFNEYVKAESKKLLNKKDEFKYLTPGMFKRISSKNLLEEVNPGHSDPALALDCACVLTENLFPDYYVDKKTSPSYTSENYTEMKDGKYQNGRAWLESEEGLNAIADLNVAAIVNYIRHLNDNNEES